MNRCARKRIAVLLALLWGSAAAIACTILFPTVHVGPTFRVLVTDRGRPVKGLRIQLTTGDDKSLTVQAAYEAVTDQKGSAVFNQIAPGRYFLAADHDAGIGDGFSVEVSTRDPIGVSPGDPADGVLHIKWPSKVPFQVRELKGTLRPDSPTGRLTVSLLEAITGKTILATETDGAFSFPDQGPGIYFLKVLGYSTGEAESINGLIPVELTKDAPDERLDILVGESSCGLYYTDQKLCERPRLTVAHVAGRVVDVMYAVVPNAEIVLSASNSLTSLQPKQRSNAEGRFTFPDLEDGSYQLVVKSPGFSPLRQTLYVSHIADSRTPIEIVLGVAGSCSKAQPLPRLIP